MDPRDRDPRDPFVDALDLPCGLKRELVQDERERLYDHSPRQRFDKAANVEGPAIASQQVHRQPRPTQDRPDMFVVLYVQPSYARNLSMTGCIRVRWLTTIFKPVS